MDVNLNVFPYCHSYYEELLENPPPGVEYSGLFELGATSYVEKNGLPTRIALFLENHAEGLWGALGTPSFRPAVTGDLVHSERLVLGWKPYVVSFDHVGFLTDYRFDRLYEIADEGGFARYLERDRCRRLLPWSEAAKRSFLEVVGDDVAHKVDVVYPAVESRDISRTYESDTPLSLLFVATDFYLKGGTEVLRAFERLTDQFDVELTMITDPPTEVREQYADLPVTFEAPTFSRDELYDRFYSTADVLLHPTHNDSFGMVYLEAMNAGLPVVTTAVFATPEIVHDGETGTLISRPETCLFRPDQTPDPAWRDSEQVRSRLATPEPGLVDELEEATAALLADADRRRRYGERARARVTSGEFSIAHRNERLREIYEESI